MLVDPPPFGDPGCPVGQGQFLSLRSGSAMRLAAFRPVHSTSVGSGCRCRCTGGLRCLQRIPPGPGGRHGGAALGWLAPGRLSSLGRSGAGRCSRGQRSAGRRECCRLRPDSALSSGCGTVRGSRASGNPSLATPYDAANPVPGTVSRSVSDGAIDAFPGQVGVAVMPRALLDHVLIHPPQRGRPALSGLIVGNPVRHLDHIVQVTLGRGCQAASMV